MTARCADLYIESDCRIVWPMQGAWLTWTDARTGVGRATGMGGKRGTAAGRNRGLGRRRAGQNGEVTPRGVAYEDVGPGGRLQAERLDGLSGC